MNIFEEVTSIRVRSSVHCRPGGPAKGEVACYDLDLLVPVHPSEQQSIPILDGMPPNPMLEHVGPQVLSPTTIVHI